jgi:hypothetical protein
MRILRFLLKKGANLEAADNRKQTPLHVVVQTGSIETVRYLLEQHADLHAVDWNGEFLRMMPFMSLEKCEKNEKMLKFLGFPQKKLKFFFNYAKISLFFAIYAKIVKICTICAKVILFYYHLCKKTIIFCYSRKKRLIFHTFVENM